MLFLFVYLTFLKFEPRVIFGFRGPGGGFGCFQVGSNSSGHQEEKPLLRLPRRKPPKPPPGPPKPPEPLRINRKA